MTIITEHNWQYKQHSLLLEGDPVAPSIISERIYPIMIRHLECKYQRVSRDLIVSAATDAMINYLKRPQQYDPQRSSLEGYLKMAADGDLKNLLKAAQKRSKKEILFDPMLLDSNNGKDDVELFEGSPELILEREFIGQSITAPQESEMFEKEQESLLAQIFSDEVDQRLGLLVINGIRETSHYADVLCINALPVPEQRVLVKQHKDRIKKRLERAGVKK